MVVELGETEIFKRENGKPIKRRGFVELAPPNLAE